MKTLLIITLLLITVASLLISFSKERYNNDKLVNAPHIALRAPLRQKVKAIYDSQIGVREATGRNDGPQVEQYLCYTGLGKGNAWCAAFVCWVLGQANVENPKTAWAASLFPNDKVIWKQGMVAKSYKAQSEKRSVRTCLPDRQATRNSQHTTKKACVFGLYFRSLKRIAHCGFIDQWGEKEAITVEGNTNDSGSREGDGVYRKRRPIKSLYAVADWIGKEDHP